MQAFGRILAVALDHDLELNQPSVLFVDASNPLGKAARDSIIQRVPLQSMV